MQNLPPTAAAVASWGVLGMFLLEEGNGVIQGCPTVVREAGLGVTEQSHDGAASPFDPGPSGQDAVV